MKLEWTALFLGASLIAACSPEAGESAKDADMTDHTGHHMAKVSDKEAAEKAEAAKLLVDRFDAKACAKADLLGAMRRTEASGREQIVRGFSASVACAEALTVSVENLGFGSDEDGVFASAPTAVPKEKVLIEIAEDASGAVVEWEIDNR